MKLHKIASTAFTAMVAVSLPFTASAAVLRASQAVPAKAVRADETLGKQSELAPAVLIGVLATVAIIGGAVVLADSDDSPDSP